MAVLTWEHIIVVVTALGAFSGVIAIVVTAIANRDKTAAEARHEDAQAGEARASGAAQLLSASSDFVAQLVGRVACLEKDTAAQDETIRLLLRNDKERKAKIEALETAGAKQRDVIAGQQVLIARLQLEVNGLKAENTKLRKRIAELEAENARLRGVGK